MSLNVSPRAPSCVIVVENLPVPFDRRVWQEAQALKAAGWTVTVICPSTDQYPLSFETLDGIDIHRHPLPIEARGALGFLVEYAAALFHEARLLVKVARKTGFDVIQACNPPDLIFLVAWPFKLFSKRFVFDHHDVSPELFAAKYGKKGFLHRLLLVAERLTFATADLVISANDTYRDIAIKRGGKDPNDVVTVYSVPDRDRLRRVEPDPAVRSQAQTILGYVGIIGDQDGVDHLVRAAHLLKTQHGVTGFKTVIVGDGPALPGIRKLAEELDVGDVVSFTGYLSGNALLAHLSAFDIGVIPDPVNEYNDKISMNKVFEYSALGIPIVSYDLTETRRLLGDAGNYAATPDPAGLAEAIFGLIEAPPLRAAKAAQAKSLADASFSWERESAKYVAAFNRLVKIPD
ncbi:glycosyltransferase WbuB [Alsobacter metallidurans]|uniref:Glycosyltransferase WbuB n=1 Tax=Alsobacter metallidurans TaxID=340221 RepID=A0A917I7C1_9HYPH|nr:glycosyltransferase family 4 protein [Alsobacter metallidurans]GGH17284.1 glycosyltransferase WbuB [Alsobacter metallidurans]